MHQLGRAGFWEQLIHEAVHNEYIDGKNILYENICQQTS
jgi:hypothetical protein